MALILSHPHTHTHSRTPNHSHTLPWLAEAKKRDRKKAGRCNRTEKKEKHDKKRKIERERKRTERLRGKDGRIRLVRRNRKGPELEKGRKGREIGGFGKSNEGENAREKSGKPRLGELKTKREKREMWGTFLLGKI